MIHGKLQFTPSLSREVISVRSAQKSRELRREMLRQQYFCASRSVLRSRPEGE